MLVVLFAALLKLDFYLQKSEVLGLQSKWQVPKSWNLNYGSTFNHHIY